MLIAVADTVKAFTVYALQGQQCAHEFTLALRYEQVDNWYWSQDKRYGPAP